MLSISTRAFRDKTGADAEEAKESIEGAQQRPLDENAQVEAAVVFLLKNKKWEKRRKVDGKKKRKGELALHKMTKRVLLAGGGGVAPPHTHTHTKQNFSLLLSQVDVLPCRELAIAFDFKRKRSRCWMAHPTAASSSSSPPCSGVKAATLKSHDSIDAAAGVAMAAMAAGAALWEWGVVGGRLFLPQQQQQQQQHLSSCVSATRSISIGTERNGETKTPPTEHSVCRAGKATKRFGDGLFRREPRGGVDENGEVPS